MDMRSTREITSADELRRCSGGDSVALWAAQGMAPGVRAWRRGDAVAVAAPFLACRDRLAIRGPAEQVAALVTEVLGVVGPTYRLFGDDRLVTAVAERVPDLKHLGSWGWMELDGSTRPRTASAARPPAEGPARVRWLDQSWAGRVAELLDVAYPGSWVRPGMPAVRRWAGAFTPDGELAAVCADAWAAPEVGYLCGVAAHPRWRGRGYAGAVLRFAVDALLAEHGRVALMVDSDNGAAVTLYERCGFRWRTVAAAGLTAPRAA
jgi:ribosomal protein S18 acetylase RimI-like enzyme